MGRIITEVSVTNRHNAVRRITISVMVETGATHLVLPLAMKDQLGDFFSQREATARIASGKTVTGLVCGPAMLELQGFPTAWGEVMFLEMEEEPQPLLGYLPLEHFGAAVDMLGHRLVHVQSLDLF